MSVRARARYEITAEDKSKKAFASFGASLRGTVKMMGGLSGAIGALVGAGGLGLLVKQTLDAGDQINDLSNSLGISTEALSRFRYVAKLSGVEFTGMANAFKFMLKNVSEAAIGTGAASDALRILGLDAQALKQLAPEQQFLAIADAMQAVKSANDRVNLSMRIFGKSGSDMIRVMQGGSEALREMMGEADRLGLTLSKTEAEGMAATNDALDRMRGSVEGLSNKLTIALAPAIEGIANALTTILPGAVTAAIGAFNVLRLVVSSVFLGIAKLAEGTFTLLGKLPGRVGAGFRSLAAGAAGVSESLLATTTGIADQVLGVRPAGVGRSKPASVAPVLSSLAPSGQAPDVKSLKSFLSRMDEGGRVGMGRQIDLTRESLNGVGVKKQTIVGGPMLEQMNKLLQAILEEQRRNNVVVTA